MYLKNHINDEYFISLQIIIENFVHFLVAIDGVGSIYIESRNAKENALLQGHFYQLLNCGTLFINSKNLQDHLSTMNFQLKSENNVGLQLADFIPISLININLGRHDYYGLGQLFKTKLYGGYDNMSERFGLKNLL